MSKFIKEVLRTNPIIQSAEATVDKEQSNFSQSQRPIYNPGLIIDAQRVNNVELLDTYTAGISQQFDIYNKRGARANVGNYNYIRARENLSVKKLEVSTQTLKSLAVYRLQQKIVKLAKERSQVLYKFKVQNYRKFKSGDIAQVALDQAALAYAEAIAQQANEEIKLSEAQQRLIILTQMPYRKWGELPMSLPIPPSLTGNKKEELIRNLPVIRFFNAKVSIARAQIRARQTETRSDPTLSVRSGTEDDQFLIGGGINIPLFVRNDYTDKVKAAAHEAIAIEKTRRNIFRETRAELSGSLDRYQILYEGSRKWSDVSKASLNNGIVLINKLWSAGELSTTDYLVKLKQRIDSQIAGEALKIKAWKMWFSVMQASGELDNWLNKH